MKGTQRPSPLLATLQAGIALHNRGQLEQADGLYRRVLQQNPRHPDALHLRALVAHAQARFQEAAQLAESAIRAAPQVANFRNTAGDAWRRLGKLEQAKAHLKEAIRIDARMVMAHHNLALVLLAEGHPADARESNRRALDLNPGYIEAMASGVEIAGALGDDALATDFLQRMGTSAPSTAITQATVGYHIACARRLLKGGSPEAADRAASAAIEAAPEFWGGWLVRTDALAEIGRMEQALSCAETAARLAPDNEDACLNLAILLNRQKRHAEAEAQLTDWLTKHPQHPGATFTRAAAQLAQGKYSEGWQGYEARWETPWHQAARAPFPLWSGQPVARLLIYCEQGLGDSVMMMRFLPEVQRRSAAAITLCIQPPLQRLAERVLVGTGIRVIVDPGSMPFDAACPLMSLPFVLGINSPAAFLGGTAYLRADPLRVAMFRDRLAQYPGRKLGLVWQGNVAAKMNRLRTIQEADLLPLLSLEGWSAVSLQYGCKAPMIGGLPLIDVSESIQDFEDLAALMEAVDTTVSLDTGPVHLAGSLGIPVHTLLPWIHDWRWGVDGDMTPWYAEMVLYRQTGDGAWASAIAKLARRLQSLGATRTSNHAAP